MSNKSFSYCLRIHNYDQYLHDVGELRAMGYSIDDRYNAKLLQDKLAHPLWLHVTCEGGEDTPEACLHTHAFLAETVPNLEYIINELPVIKTSKSV